MEFHIVAYPAGALQTGADMVVVLSLLKCNPNSNHQDNKHTEKFGFVFVMLRELAVVWLVQFYWVLTQFHVQVVCSGSCKEGKVFLDQQFVR